jgi:hypothetical protein
MSDNLMIIKTRKLSPKEVKKKLHDFIDEISDDCGPEIEDMAEELKAHGDEFIDALSGKGYQRGGNYRNDGGGYQRGGMNGGGGSYRNGGMNRAWHRNDGTWEEREEQRKRNEQKLQELDKQLQEMKQQMQDM